MTVPPVTTTDAEKPVGTDETEGSRPSAVVAPRSKGPASEGGEEKPYGFREARAPDTVPAETELEGTAELTPAEPEEFTPRVRRGEAEPLQTDAPDEPATVAMDKKARTQESVPHRAMGANERSKDVLFAGEAPTGDQGLQINESDTLGPTGRWPQRLEAEARHLRTLAESEQNRGERASRWRTIGDLWEWIGRKENSPEAFAKAIEAYRIAAEIDPRSAALDSTRVRRARLRSTEEIQGNILPAQR